MWKGMNHMNLTRAAGAGTDKSGDVLVWAEPGGSPVQIEVESSVADLFGGAILAAVQETAAACGVTAWLCTARLAGSSPLVRFVLTALLGIAAYALAAAPLLLRLWRQLRRKPE